MLIPLLMRTVINANSSVKMGANSSLLDALAQR
jgi:hypothetical protein